MNKKTVLVAPLLLAIALSFLATPAAAFVNNDKCVYSVESVGKGFGRIGRWQYVCGPASFSYHLGVGEAALFIHPDELYQGIWEINCESLRVYKCLQTFKATYDEGDFKCGDIRIIVFYKEVDAEQALVVVYGWGVFYIGHDTAPWWDYPPPCEV